MKSCENCKNCILHDYGYSNYTVEGTNVICSKSVHPNGEFDRFYGTDLRLNWAESCPQFEAGEALILCVDYELSEYSPEEQEIIKQAGLA
jgi:hypothetical protein